MRGCPIILIGGGEGSVEVAKRLLKSLPSDLPAGLVLHLLPAAGDKAADPVRQLRSQSGLPVMPVASGKPVAKARVLVVPPGRAALFGRDGLLNLAPAEAVALRPFDRLFISAAAVFGARLIGVVLSGAGDDGTAGLRSIKAAGGISIVQSPSDSANAAMPVNALIGDQPDHSALIQQIAPLLVRFALRLDAQHR